MVQPEQKELLKQIAKLGGLHDYVTTTSGELAEGLGVSQQTASRKILDLLDEGLISRQMGTRRQRIRLSPEGVDVLRNEYSTYKAIFSAGEYLTIHGQVLSGLGEGEYYISRPGYRKEFNRIFGFDPYPGTLNVEVEPMDREKLEELEGTPGILIEGFESEGRTFGGVKCFFATVGGVEAGAILPIRSHHAHVLEMVSPHRLRDKLDLDEGQRVEIRVDLDASRP